VNVSNNRTRLIAPHFLPENDVATYDGAEPSKIV
jgi:hypothetical protein